MKYNNLSLTKAVQNLIGKSQIEALGLPRATEAAAVEWLLCAGAPVGDLLVIREALKDLRVSGTFNFQADEEDISGGGSENSSIENLNATIIRNMMAANTSPENVLDESKAAPTPYGELNLFIRNAIAEVQSFSNPMESAAQLSDLVKRLWESDSASALTNEAAREIEKISAELERAKKSSQTAWLQVETAFLKLQRHGTECSTNQLQAPRFMPGTSFKTGNLLCTVSDVLTTYNLAGEPVKQRYLATHQFIGQTVTDHDVCETTIARGLVKAVEN
jgi:hypothetical protein